MSSSKEEFHQVMETNVDDAEIPAPNTSRNQIAMMYLASERRNRELEDQLEKANETNDFHRLDNPEPRSGLYCLSRRVEFLDK